MKNCITIIQKTYNVYNNIRKRLTVHIKVYNMILFTIMALRCMPVTYITKQLRFKVFYLNYHYTMYKGNETPILPLNIGHGMHVQKVCHHHHLQHLHQLQQTIIPKQ